MTDDEYLRLDPSAAVPYELDWSDWLAPGDVITTHAWSISPAASLAGETASIVIVAGLEAGRVYHLRGRITTGQGLVEDQTIVIRAEHT